jgi:hypothetical protein
MASRWQLTTNYELQMIATSPWVNCCDRSKLCRWTMAPTLSPTLVKSARKRHSLPTNRIHFLDLATKSENPSKNRNDAAFPRIAVWRGSHPRAKIIYPPYGQIAQPNRKALVGRNLGIVAVRGSHPDGTSEMAIEGAPRFRQQGSRLEHRSESYVSAICLSTYRSAGRVER